MGLLFTRGEGGVAWTVTDSGGVSVWTVTDPGGRRSVGTVARRGGWSVGAVPSGAGVVPVTCGKGGGAGVALP